MWRCNTLLWWRTVKGSSGHACVTITSRHLSLVSVDEKIIGSTEQWKAILIPKRCTWYVEDRLSSSQGIWNPVCLHNKRGRTASFFFKFWRPYLFLKLHKLQFYLPQRTSTPNSNVNSFLPSHLAGNTSQSFSRSISICCILASSFISDRLRFSL